MTWLGASLLVLAISLVWTVWHAPQVRPERCPYGAGDCCGGPCEDRPACMRP